MTRARDVADNQENLGGGVPPFVAGKNKIINGDFGIWQRGTSFSGSSAYTADRFVTFSDSGGTISRQTFTAGTAPVSGYEGSYFIRVDRSAGGTFANITQKIEDVRIFAGQTFTVSFWAKASTAQTLTIRPQQLFGSGGSGDVIIGSPTVNATTSWARYSVTFTAPSITGKTIGTGSALYVECYWLTSAAMSVDIWGVQVEAGSVATPFTTATGTVQGELAACQRYYQIIPAGAVTATNSTTRVAFSTEFPPMRTTTPTFSLTGPLVITDLYTANFTQSATEITTNLNNGNNGATLSFNNFSGLTAYRGYQITGAQQILASAEL